MGYEKGITRVLSGMLLEGAFPAVMPLGPRGHRAKGDPAGGGTPNHELLARTARLVWAAEKGVAAEVDREADGLLAFYSNQVQYGFMTRADANEQISPSHSSWWLTAATALRWWAIDRPSHRRLFEAAGEWLAHHHRLCRLFATPVGIVAPGARAWPGDTYGKCKVRDELYFAIECETVRKVWAAENQDMLSLLFADKLLKRGDDLGCSGKGKLPVLRWAIRLQRRGEDFTAWMPETRQGKNPQRVQRLAVWEEGRERYGFDDAQEEEWGVPVRMIGARTT